MATNLEYMNLSTLSYIDFSGVTPGTSISSLITSGRISGDDLDKTELHLIKGIDSPLRSWQLISFEPNTSTGFAGAAFRSPEGEIVFAFRGTEVDQGLTALLDDFMTDAQIAIEGISPEPNQFKDAEAFVNSVINNSLYSGASYSFTGHSLGGGLAAYMTYKTEHAATTFNAVGIGHLVPIDTYEVTDYANQNDIVGNYGLQMGTTVHTLDASQPVHIASDLLIRLGGVAAIGGNALYLTQSHGMDKMLQSDGNGGFAIATGGSAITQGSTTVTILFGLSQAVTFTRQTLGPSILAKLLSMPSITHKFTLSMERLS